jgi:hypothetical protein
MNSNFGTSLLVKLWIAWVVLVLVVLFATRMAHGESSAPVPAAGLVRP